MTALPVHRVPCRARFALRAAVAFIVVTLAGCSDEPDPLAQDTRPPEAIYAEAEALLAEGETLEAAELYDEIERLYPYSQYAKRAMLRAAEAYYAADEYETARLSAERFLSLYPADAAAPRAQSLVASSWYDQIVDVGRDQGATRNAQAALRELVARYPDSEMAREAQLKLDLTEDHLAGKEMTIGRYYLKRDLYVAAINRFRTVVEQYQTTSHTAEALHRLVEAYLALGVTREAETAAAVLGYNFPGSPWYASSYDLLTGANTSPQLRAGGWLERAYSQVIEGNWL
jgi:outer membrane protein assembly factor BamD